MTDLDALIHYWESILAGMRDLLEVTAMNQIEFTIKYLKELKKLKEEE